MNDPEASLDRHRTRLIALGEADAALEANSRELDELVAELEWHKQWSATPAPSVDGDFAPLGVWYTINLWSIARCAWLRQRALSLTVQNRVISRVDIGDPDRKGAAG